MALGLEHSVLLLSDGDAVAFGRNSYGQCEIPELPDEEEDPAASRYIGASAGISHTALLRSDGQAVVFGSTSSGECQVPELPAGTSYVQVVAGYTFTLLLRSDGVAVAFGDNSAGQCNLPELLEGQSYVGAAAGRTHAVLLREDGSAVAWGLNNSGSCTVPDPPEGVRYVDAAAGGDHTVLIRDDGEAVAFGHNGAGQCDLPPPVEVLRSELSPARACATWRALLAGLTRYFSETTGSHSVWAAMVFGSIRIGGAELRSRAMETAAAANQDATEGGWYGWSSVGWGVDDWRGDRRSSVSSWGSEGSASGKWWSTPQGPVWGSSLDEAVHFALQRGWFSVDKQFCEWWSTQGNGSTGTTEDEGQPSIPVERDIDEAIDDQQPEYKEKKQPRTGKEDIPSFDGTTSMREYRRRVKLFESVTGIDKPYRGGRLLEKLSGQAWKAAETLEIEALRTENGVEVLLNHLQSELEPIEYLRTFEVLNHFFKTFKRQRGEEMTSYDTSFRVQCEKLKEVGTVLEGSAKAWWFLEKANIGDDLRQKVVTAANGDYEYNKLRQALVAIVPNSQKVDDSTASTSARPTHSARTWQRGGKGSSFKVNAVVEEHGESEGLQAGEEDDAISEAGLLEREAEVLVTQAAKKRAQVEKARGFQQVETPADRTKRIQDLKKRLPCSACKAKGRMVYGHWHSDPECPENKSNKSTSGTFVTSHASSDDDEEDDMEAAYMVEGTGLVMATSHQLRAQSRGLALSDTCCARTVAGERWVARHLEVLDGRQAEYKIVKEREPFRFGGGPKVFSKFAVIIPLMIHGADTVPYLRVSVVAEDVPLLVSQPALRSLGMVMDLVGGVFSFAALNAPMVELITTDTGHVGFDIVKATSAGSAQPDWGEILHIDSEVWISSRPTIIFLIDLTDPIILLTFVTMSSVTKVGAPRVKADYVARIAEQSQLEPADLDKMTVDRLKELWRVMKPPKTSPVLEVGWKKKDKAGLLQIYVEQVIPWYGLQNDGHWTKYSRAKFIVEIENWVLEKQEEQKITGGCQENTTPLAPYCENCHVPMLEKRNRLTHEVFWGCPVFPVCRATLPKNVDGKPAAIVQAAMDKNKGKGKNKSKGVGAAASTKRGNPQSEDSQISSWAPVAGDSDLEELEKVQVESSVKEPVGALVRDPEELRQVIRRRQDREKVMRQGTRKRLVGNIRHIFGVFAVTLASLNAQVASGALSVAKFGTDRPDVVEVCAGCEIMSKHFSRWGWWSLSPVEVNLGGSCDDMSMIVDRVDCSRPRLVVVSCPPEVMQSNKQGLRARAEWSQIASELFVRQTQRGDEALIMAPCGDVSVQLALERTNCANDIQTCVAKGCTTSNGKPKRANMLWLSSSYELCDAIARESRLSRHASDISDTAVAKVCAQTVIKGFVKMLKNKCPGRIYRLLTAVQRRLKAKRAGNTTELRWSERAVNSHALNIDEQRGKRVERSREPTDGDVLPSGEAIRGAGDGDTEIAQRIRCRYHARIEFIKAQSKDMLDKTLQNRTRKALLVDVGDTVFFWREAKTKKSARKFSCWNGPACVVGKQKKQLLAVVWRPLLLGCT
ncbi:HERC4 [Symbiodinium natans]|uniref:HERC4 protein n=1 Tax=Symbiodinium natans TaxID=878477 RepID=A0A812MJD7_9DINO|nr:HERC4 [Symbiodinium natans]